MFLSNLFKLTNPLDFLRKETAVRDVTETNTHTEKYQLRLSEQEAMEIVLARDDSLKRLGRVEIGLDLITKIILAFRDSPYINQADYADTISDLVEMFYYMKNCWASNRRTSAVFMP